MGKKRSDTGHFLRCGRHAGRVQPKAAGRKRRSPSESGDRFRRRPILRCASIIKIINFLPEI